MIRHILLIKFKETTSSQQIAEIEQRFYAITDEIAEVKSVEWGVNNSPEGLAKGYTHAVLMSFADEAGRDRYLPHPAHERLKEIFVAQLADIVVFDYQV